MKQTLPEIIRKNENFRQFLLAQEGGIMKFWAEHPDRDFDANLFDDYEKQLVKAYLQANNRNRTIVSLQGDELKLEARNWYRLTEKEIHYKVVLQPILATLPKGISEQVNQHIDDYLADAYRDYRRCFFSNGITPLAFYDEVVKQFGTGGLARDCMDYVLREHHYPEVWSKKKREYTLMREFFIRQYSEMIPEDAYKLLRQAVKEKLEGKSPDECRLEAIKTMKLVKDFSRMIYSSAEVITSDCTGRYKVDKKFLRELVGGNAALLLLSKAKVPPLHECFFNFVSLLNDIGRIWAARLLKDYNIDMHELEKETGAILYPVTEPLQNPDGAVHDNYEYYVDKDYSDTLDDQCCIYDEKQAKELLDALQNEIKRENLAEIFKKEIKQLVDSINKRPELVMRLSKFVPLVKFDWSCIEAIICGLKSELLMDKAILVIVDAWERYTQKKDDICYETIEHFREYAYGQNGMYEVNRPIRMLKYIDIEKDLEGIKDSELKRRRIDAKFKKELESSQRIDAGKPKKLREPVDLKTATHSFILKLKNVNEKERNERIATFFSDLSRNGKYIHEKTNAQDFVDNFTGKHTAEKIVWTAEFKQLLYLISTLNQSGVLKWNTEKPKPGIRQMICIVFQIQEHEYNDVVGETEKQPVTCINDIDVSRLNTTKDTSDEGLDPIIRRLLFGEASTEEGVKGLIDTEGVSK